MKALHLLGLIGLMAASGQSAVFAQDGPDVEERPLEVGVQVTGMGIKFPPVEISGAPNSGLPSVVVPPSEITTYGIGGRIGYNVTKNVAIEGEVNILPERNFNETFQSRRVQAFAGVKVGKRWEKVGVFAKARPGVMNFSEYGPDGPCTFSFPTSTCREDSRTFFAADLGGVFEYYPTERTIIRVDAGDTLIRFGESGPITFPPMGTFLGSTSRQRAETTHNFQLSVGFGFRF